MAADKKKNICVVGDDDQSIYGFRGVSDTIFQDFIKRFPDTKKIILGTNYRSFPYIITGADKCSVYKRNVNGLSTNKTGTDVLY